MIQAPESFCIVGADVDSQELWIAAVLGDAHHLGQHGSTRLGWMTLQGTKAAGTDMHSMTAKTCKCTRDEAKILNYGRIYGAGVRFASQLRRQFNPDLSQMEARNLASKMYKETKGDRSYTLNEKGRELYEIVHGRTIEQGDFVNKRTMSKLVGMWKKKREVLKKRHAKGKYAVNDLGAQLVEQLDPDWDPEALTMSQLGSLLYELKLPQWEEGDDSYRKGIKDLAATSRWVDGSESHTFNRLEEIALSTQPRTPVLGCRISQMLETKMVGEDYLPSRINWVVQSSAVDYLHLLLSAMNWLVETNGLRARFLISIHDEVRYLVHKEDKDKLVMCLQVSNLLVRSMFASRLGMTNLPLDVAFFSEVDVDSVMRKDPKSECVTPSNPRGLTQGHGIPKGETVSVEETMELFQAHPQSLRN